MHNKGLPVPADIESASEAVEFLGHINEAIENAGGDAQLTIEALLAFGGGAIAGVDAAGVVVLGGIAQTVAAVYIFKAAGCLGSAAGEQIRKLFASNELPDFMVEQLRANGVELSDTAVV
jgi:hypothetical protein